MASVIEFDCTQLLARATWKGKKKVSLLLLAAYIEKDSLVSLGLVLLAEYFSAHSSHTVTFFRFYNFIMRLKKWLIF